ncbi:MAG: helix-hairpin-helix domain-containing protein [Planctomycetes bacterium]|nr:helix-hairpin-helix domain-containing protein [Planctomycetota bacterium]
MKWQSRWFQLSGRELRVLVIAAALAIAGLSITQTVRAMRRGGGFEVVNVPERLGYPERLDLNNAKVYELQLLPGIGKVTAKEIVRYRRGQGPFEHLDDLEKIRGVGPKTIEKLRPHVMCVPPDVKDNSRSN